MIGKNIRWKWKWSCAWNLKNKGVFTLNAPFYQTYTGVNYTEDYYPTAHAEKCLIGGHSLISFNYSYVCAWKHSKMYNMGVLTLISIFYMYTIY